MKKPDVTETTTGTANAGGQSAIGLRQNNNATLPVTVPGFLDSDECRRAIELFESQPEHDAKIAQSEEALEYGVRKSLIRWVKPDQSSRWLFLKLQELIQNCNSKYMFDIQGFYEGIQFARYNEGGHFDWHMDVGHATRSLRKLSVSVQLSDAGDYEGGELEFMGQEQTASREKGAAIIFPTFLFHRVTPVTRGSRLAMITWVHGNAFR